MLPGNRICEWTSNATENNCVLSQKDERMITGKKLKRYGKNIKSYHRNTSERDRYLMVLMKDLYIIALSKTTVSIM